MTTETRRINRFRQQGGLTIILALVLVGVMGAATFSLSRNAIRELSMAGTIMQGNKAAAAADAGLDWVVIWGHGAVSQTAFDAASPSARQVAFLASIKALVASTTGDAPATFSGSGVADMALNQNATAATDQNFDIELRFLGTLPAGSGLGSSDNSGASGGTKVGGTPGDYGWRALATGRATPRNGQTYQAQRELIATLPLF